MKYSTPQHTATEFPPRTVFQVFQEVSVSEAHADGKILKILVWCH